MKKEYYDGTSWGNSNSYDGTEQFQQLTREQLERFYPKKQHVDVNLLALRNQLTPDQDIDQFIQAQKPIDDRALIRFNWTYRNINPTKGGARNRIRTGILTTSRQNYSVWGLPSFVEFNNHLHYLDKQQARDCYYEIIAGLPPHNTGDYDIGFWVVKTFDHNQTVPGTWAISVEERFIDRMISKGNCRSIIFWHRGEYHVRERLKISAESQTQL